MRTASLALAFSLLLLTLGGTDAAEIGWQDKVDSEVLAAATGGTAEFFVYLAEQADLSAAAELTGKHYKGIYVHNRLTAVADAAQPPVAAVLTALGAEHRRFWIVNAIWARGDLAVVQAMASRPDVAAIYPSGVGYLDPPLTAPGGASSAATASVGVPEWNIAHVRAPEAWALGYTGQGVVVAGADTGVEWTHPALQGKYRGWNGTSADHDYNWFLGATPNQECTDPSEPCDDDALLGGGHGSHTVGTMVGDDGMGNRIGMAPGAEWIACRNMNFGVGTVPSYLACMEFFLAPTDVDGNNPDPTRAPHVVNNSWACAEACATPLLEAQLEASRAAGIVYVVSAGNFGPDCSTILFPLAIYPGAFTVGATDDTDAIAGFSSRGPIVVDPPDPPLSGPDVSAPGVGVRSVQKGGGYGSLSGTSMAGPHVAGLVALVLSADPSLAGQVERIEEIIAATTVQLTTDEGCGGDGVDQVPNNTFGWGRIDALAAVEKALAEQPVCADGDDDSDSDWDSDTDSDSDGDCDSDSDSD